VEVFGGGISAELVNFRAINVYGAAARGRTRYLNQAKGFVQEAQAVVASLAEGSAPPIAFDEVYAVSRAAILAQHAIAAGERLIV
jgi:hypothetical protein